MGKFLNNINPRHKHRVYKVYKAKLCKTGYKLYPNNFDYALDNNVDNNVHYDMAYKRAYKMAYDLVYDIANNLAYDIANDFVNDIAYNLVNDIDYNKNTSKSITVKFTMVDEE